MDFFIKQNSTLPILKFSLTEKLMRKHNIDDNMMESVGITFSMRNEGGIYKIANKIGDLFIKEINTNELIGESKYVLLYKFTKRDTKTYGLFEGEFKLDFTGDNSCGKITLPNNNKIQIYIEKSITNSSLVY